MTPSKPTLCLCMIVKNEMANLPRCLESIVDQVACWCIGDTGSSDDTPAFIEGFFAERHIPGELHRFPFHDFSQARNEALERAKASGLSFDYLLLMDADMELVVQDPAFAEGLNGAAYQVLQNSGVLYWNNRLLRRDVTALYRGVTHEFLDVLEGETEKLEGIVFKDHATGSNRIDKYDRDLRLLTDALAVEQDGHMAARYTFYLANTLRDAGRSEGALEQYLRRAEQGYWQDEVFVSLLNAARLMTTLGHPEDAVIAAYQRAIAANPQRAEARHGLSRYLRQKDRFAEGVGAAEPGLSLTATAGLFVEAWIYDWGLKDEFAVNAYWTGRYKDCLSTCIDLLSNEALPKSDRDRIAKNARFALDKL